MSRTMTIKQAQEYLRALSNKINGFNKEFIERLADEGLEVARMEYKSAPYSGINDVSVDVEYKGEGNRYTAKIRASGTAVLFIEFGTGIFHDSNEEERAMVEKGNVLKHGEYGYGLARNGAWTYTGEMGSNPPDGTTKLKNGKVWTTGNEPTPAMYDARKRIMDIYIQTVKEVFKL